MKKKLTRENGTGRRGRVGGRRGGTRGVEGSTGRTSPVVFTTYHRKSMIARTARFNEIPFPFLYMWCLLLPSDHSSASCTRADVRICPAMHRLGRRMLKPKNLWRNPYPTRYIYMYTYRAIYPAKTICLLSAREFSNAWWIRRSFSSRFGQFTRLRYSDSTSSVTEISLSLFFFFFFF